MRIVRYDYPTSHRFAPALSAFRQSPWTGLETEISRLFESTLGDFVAAPATDRFAVDLYEDRENAYVRAELPGMKRDDIHVELVEGELKIAVSRQAKEGDDEESFSYSRSLTVPETVQADKVSAAYEDGVLTVTMPKKEEAKPKKIAVAVK